MSEDRLDMLSRAVYGRRASVRDWIGGSDALILEDAAKKIAELEAKMAACEKVLYRAVRELEFVQSVEGCHSGLCATAAGKEIIEEGMSVLGVKDLSTDELPNPPQQGKP